MADHVDGPRCLIVVGASARGVEALKQLVGGLREGLRAAVAIVLHVSSSGPSVLTAILERAGDLTVQSARHGVALRPGCVYVAPPGRHLDVDPGTLALRHGPRENGHRPAIDRLFTSGAESFGQRC